MKRIFLALTMSLLSLSLLSCDKKVEDNTNNDKVEENKDDNKDQCGSNTEKEPDGTIYDKNGNTLLSLTNSYYKSVSGTLNNKEEFKKNLHALIEQSHTKHLTYKECWNACEKADEDPNNSNNIVCIYSGESILKSKHVGSAGQKGDWNREHLFPQSRGFKDKDAVAHNDIHHLRAAEYSTNSSRGDTDFGEGGSYFTPRKEVRGDIARALLYMAVRYNEDDYTTYTYNGKTYTDSDDLDLELVNKVSSKSQQSTGEYVIGNLEFLIKWNYEDPVDDVERKRNDVVYSIQGNRNPFIDYNDFVAYLYPEFAKEYTDIKKIEYLL